MPISISGDGPITGITSLNTAVSSTELGYLDGVTSALQTQINAAGGLVKITDQSFSAASSVSVNNCYTTTYDNYRIFLSLESSVASIDIFMRMRASGSDNTTTNYRHERALFDISSTISQGFTQTSFIISKATDGGRTTIVSLDVAQPALARMTSWHSQWYHVGNNSGLYAGGFLSTTQFDGFTIYPTSGTITGDLRVYGYRN